MPSTLTVFFSLVLLIPAAARAQSFEVLGTRAAGMGGAFVAVANDASAVYWNPAGLALGGSYFSLVIDGSQTDPNPVDVGRAGRRSAYLIAATTLPIGVSYYRLGSTSLTAVTNPLQPATVRLERLITHHAGVTLVQSVSRNIAVSSTFKMVRGVAAAGFVADGDRDGLLSDAGDLPDEATTKFDADIGMMVSLGALRAGVTVRNVREPEFATAGGESIELKRQSRAGLAYYPVPGLIVSADWDLERAKGSLGDVRNFAIGTEAQLFPRAFFRTGLRLNMLDDQPGGRARVYSLGGSVAVLKAIFIDAQATLGDEAGDRGWGVGIRMMY